MKRVALAVVLVATCLFGVVGSLEAAWRVWQDINLRQSLGLAAGDTISAQTVMDWIKVATEADGDGLVCDSLVVGKGIDLRWAGIDTVRCAYLDFEWTTFEEGVNFRYATFEGFWVVW